MRDHWLDVGLDAEYWVKKWFRFRVRVRFRFR
jgi:hypothetical protein